MTSISESAIKEQELNGRIGGFFRNHNLTKALRKSNAYKSKGVPVTQVLIYLVQLVFTNKSMYMNILNGTNTVGFCKDVVYRLLNATFINWTTMLLHIAFSATTVIAALTSEKRLNAIVIDDTMYERPRSKKVELLANVYDHAAKGKNKYKRGFRLLTLAWTDGVSLIPLLFRHMSSADRNNRYNEINSSIDKRSVGYKARQQSVQTAPETLFELLRQVKKMCVPVKHTIFDSWFSYPSTMMRIYEIGFYAVGRLKDMTTVKYLLDGEKKTLSQIYGASKKRPGKSKYLLSVPVILYNAEDKTLPARIVFVRDRNNKKKWIAFAATDMSLSEEEIIQLYGKRWDIEVFFKISKSYLNLAREFQGLSYDSIPAQTAIVMLRYIILAVEKRQNEDPRSLGELFFLTCDEAADIRIADALALVLELLKGTLNECLFLSNEQISEIIDAFISKLSRCFQGAFSSLQLAS